MQKRQLKNTTVILIFNILTFLEAIINDSEIYVEYSNSIKNNENTDTEKENQQVKENIKKTEGGI